MRSRLSDFAVEGGPLGAWLGSLLLTASVRDLEKGMKVMAGEERAGAHARRANEGRNPECRHLGTGSGEQVFLRRCPWRLAAL